MHKITSSFAVLAIALLAAASASAQAPGAQTTVSLSVGGQVTSRTVSPHTEFTDFGEIATVDSNQTAGRGFVIDGNIRRNLWGNFGVGVGVWFEHDKGSSVAVARIPDPLLTGKFTTVTAAVTDLPENVVGLNLQFFWTRPIREKYSLVVLLGPSIVHASQQIGTIPLDSNTLPQNAAGGTIKQSATSAKAGNVGVELNRTLNDKYQGGVFVRYAGGEVELPAVKHLKVGGVQVGGVIHLRF